MDKSDPIITKTDKEKRSRRRQYAKTHLDHPAIRSFLQNSVGRPWNNVFSDLSKRLKKQDWPAQQLKVYVDFLVEVHTKIVDGVVYDTRELRVRGLYVCPKSGILKRVKQEKWVRRREPKSFKTVSSDLVLKKQDGIWYACHLQQFPSGERKVQSKSSYVTIHDWLVRDAFLGDYISFLTRDVCRRAYGTLGYCYKKKQLNSRELRKFGLENGSAS